jgi:uncharacterized protein
MLKKQEVLQFLRDNREYFETQFHVKEMGLFGSFVKGKQTQNSDIDILIELRNNTKNVYEIKEMMRTYISKKFHRNIDIARKKYLKSYIKKQILDEIEYV